MPKSIIISGGLWTISGMILISLGSIFWFHFPYLLFIDEWHLVWMILSLCLSLIFSQLFLDGVISKSCCLFLTEDDSETAIAQNFIKFLWSLLILVLIEIILKLLGISRALSGLATLGIGASVLWSSRFYWFTVLPKL